MAFGAMYGDGIKSGIFVAECVIMRWGKGKDWENTIDDGAISAMGSNSQTLDARWRRWR